jgi:hypothetical protein
MKIYHYDFETGQYLGDGVADPSPLEADVWLIPAHATEIAPPKTGVDEYAIFIDNAWSIFKVAEPVNEPLHNEAISPPIILQAQEPIA